MGMNKKVLELLSDNYGRWRYQNKNNHIRIIPHNCVDVRNSEGLIYIANILLEGGFKFSIEKYHGNRLAEEDEDFIIAYDVKILDRKSKIDEVIKIIQE